MPVMFEPVNHHDAGGNADLRLTLVTAYNGAKSSRAKYLGLDFRLTPDIVRQWGLRSGDKVVGRMEDDGTWVFRIVMPSDKGYSVRIGGVRGHGGRKGYAYFRFSASPEVARQVVPPGGSNVRVFQLAGIEGRTAMFLPVTVQSGLEFVPAH